jgi:hypothetical protein
MPPALYREFTKKVVHENQQKQIPHLFRIPVAADCHERTWKSMKQHLQLKSMQLTAMDFMAPERNGKSAC